MKSKNYIFSLVLLLAACSANHRAYVFQKPTNRDVTATKNDDKPQSSVVVIWNKAAQALYDALAVEVMADDLYFMKIGKNLYCEKDRSGGEARCIVNIADSTGLITQNVNYSSSLNDLHYTVSTEDKKFDNVELDYLPKENTDLAQVWFDGDIAKKVYKALQTSVHSIGNTNMKILGNLNCSEDVVVNGSNIYTCTFLIDCYELHGAALDYNTYLDALEASVLNH